MSGRPVAHFAGSSLKVEREVLWELCEYEPHPRQQEFHASVERFKVAASGRRFGKSMSGPMDVIDLLWVPNSRGWIVAESHMIGDPEFTYMEDAVAKIRRHYKIPEKSIRHAHNTRTGEMYIEMPWGARVEVRSWRHPESLKGQGLTWCIFAEAAQLPEVVFLEYISGSLSDYRAPCIFASTPKGDNWFKEYHDLGQEPANWLENGANWEDSWKSWNFPSWENPILYPKGFDDPEIQRMMGTAEGTPYFWQEIGAKFNVFVGQIFPQFDKKEHILTQDYFAKLAALDGAVA